MYVIWTFWAIVRLPTPRGHVATAHGVRALAYFEYANFKHAVIGYLQWTMAGGRPAVWDVFHGLGTGPHAAFSMYTRIQDNSYFERL